MEPRKASDVLLDLESKVNILLDIIRAQDLNIKILSNKLNDVMARLDKQQAAPPQIVVEAVQNLPTKANIVPPGFTQVPAGDPNRNIPIVSESKLPHTDMPNGFRRNSRPETYAGDHAYLPHANTEAKMPVQLPKPTNTAQAPGQPPPGRGPDSMPPVDINVPLSNKSKVSIPPPQQQMEMLEPQPEPTSSAGQIPVMQRIVDKNGKSVFIALVEIVDLETEKLFFKTKTNGTGKWMASLNVGRYRVTITKRGNGVNKDVLQAVQDIQVDGRQSPLELPMLIIK